VAEDTSEGFQITAFPKASAGAIFQAGMAIGKFQGVMAAITPSGTLSISTLQPGRIESNRSPTFRRASPAKNWKILPALTTSAVASTIVLPVSRVMRRAIFSASLTSLIPTRPSASPRRSI
jgi:hypothetical protein